MGERDEPAETYNQGTRASAKSAVALSNERRQYRRAINENAVLALINHGTSLHCRMIDLSLGGCRLQMQDRFLAGILVRIEIAVRISGLSQRFGGVTQWTDRKQLDVIRFLDMSDRKRSQLNDLIREVMEFRDERETASKDQRGPRRIDVE